MKPDIRLRVQDRKEVQARLAASDGTMWASDGEAHGFEADARIAMTWRNASIAEVDALTPPTVGTADRTIALVAISDVHVTALRELARADAVSRQRLRSRLTALAIEICERLPACGWRFAEAHDYAGLSIARPSGNTTVNEESGQRVGLHLDNFGRLALGERHRASNRICINIGPHRRALQFAPYSVAHMLTHLRARGLDPQEEQNWPTRDGRRLDLARTFLSAFPEAPIFALSMNPGEAYIAPTENIVHDGWFDEADGVDMTFTIRGRLEPC